MSYGTIKKSDIANDAGVRVPLSVSGRTHHCPGCSSGEARDFSSGKPFIREAQGEILEALVPDYIEGLTLLRGELLRPENQEMLVPFLEKVRAHYPQKNLRCYTEYTLEQDLLKDGRVGCKYTGRILFMIGVLVDGRPMKVLKDISLPFRGSSNQRTLDLRVTLENGSMKLLGFGNGRIQAFHRDVRRYPECLLVLQFS